MKESSILVVKSSQIDILQSHTDRHFLIGSSSKVSGVSNLYVSESACSDKFE